MAHHVHTPMPATPGSFEGRPGIDRERRETFLSARALIDRASGALSALGEEIAESLTAVAEESTRDGLRALDDERRRILDDTLARFEREAPNACLDRMVQYGASLATIGEAPLDDGDDDERFDRIARPLLEWPDTLAFAFGRLATTATAEQAEAYDALRFRLIAHSRRVSRIVANRETWRGRPGEGRSQTSSSA